MKLDRAMIKYQKQLVELTGEVKAMREILDRLLAIVENTPIEMVEIGKLAIEDNGITENTKKRGRVKKEKAEV